MIPVPATFRVVIAALVTAFGLRAESHPETVAWIVTESGEPARWTIVEVAPDQNLKLRAADDPADDPADASQIKAQLTLQISRVASVTIEPAAAWHQLLSSMSITPSAELTREVAALALHYASLADLPESNGGELAFSGCEALRAAGANQECLAVLNAIFQMSRRPEEKLRANLNLAQVQAFEGNVAEAEALLVGIPTIKRSDPYFIMERMVRGQVAFLRKDYRTAIDLYAQAFIRGTPMDSWLPEAMYFIAACYVEIARDMDPMKEDNHFESVGNMLFSDLVTLYPENVWSLKAKKERGAAPRPLSDTPEPAAPPKRLPEKPVPHASASPTPEEREIR